MKCVICQTKNPRGPGWMEATVRNTTGKRAAAARATPPVDIPS